MSAITTTPPGDAFREGVRGVDGWNPNLPWPGSYRTNTPILTLTLTLTLTQILTLTPSPNPKPYHIYPTQ